MSETAPCKPPIHLRDWLCTIPFLLLFISFLIGFDVLQRIVIIISKRQHEKLTILFNKCLVWTIKSTGAKIRVENNLKLAPGIPLIIIANHQSLMDIPLITTFLAEYRPHFIAKRELTRWFPFVSYNLRHGGHAIIDRSDPQQAATAIKALGERMSTEGISVAIFPEGTRARSGELGQFRAGGLEALLAATHQAQIVPVTIDGLWKFAAYKFMPALWGVRISVVIGAALTRRENESGRELVDRVHGIACATLEEIRKVGT